jgi:tetratricopeptide (TPR) repeat protein
VPAVPGERDSLASAEELEDRRHKSKFAIVHKGIGEGLLEEGKTDEAIAAYQEAIRLNKDDPEAHMNLGNALHAKGQFDEAAAAYRQAILIKKDWFEAHYNLAVILTTQGMFREAAKEFRLGYELNAKNPFWADLSARRARDCERFAELEGIKVGREVVVAGGRVGVVLAQGLAKDVQGLLEQRLGLGVLPLELEVESEVVVARGRELVTLAQGLAVDVQGLLE